MRTSRTEGLYSPEAAGGLLDFCFAENWGKQKKLGRLKLYVCVREVRAREKEREKCDARARAAPAAAAGKGAKSGPARASSAKVVEDSGRFVVVE